MRVSGGKNSGIVYWWEASEGSCPCSGGGHWVLTCRCYAMKRRDRRRSIPPVRIRPPGRGRSGDRSARRESRRRQDQNSARSPPTVSDTRQMSRDCNYFAPVCHLFCCLRVLRGCDVCVRGSQQKRADNKKKKGKAHQNTD